MSRIIKAMMAEFSYFLEKYFGVTSIIWTILFIAFCGAIIFTVVTKVCELIYKNKKRKDKSFFTLYIGLTMFISYICNNLILMPQTWDSKLQRVMSNFKYVLSFPSNGDIFFEALKIPSNASNENNLFHIAMHLNDSQWDKIFESAGGSSWYFEKIHKAITEILRIGDYHLSLSVVYQASIIVFIPMMMVLILSIYMFYKKHIWGGILTTLSSISCVIFSFGGAIFMASMLYIGMIVWKLMDSSEQKMKIDKLKWVL